MTRQPPLASGELAALGGILLLAAVIRIATAAYPLWFDELASLVFAGEPHTRLWSGWMIRESNPPFYYSLLRLWTGAFGEADRTLRLLSIIIGLGGIAAGWALARRLGGRFAGFAAAALLSVSAAHVAFSQEVRAYALVATATLVALIGAVDFIDGGRRRGLVLYAVATLVALYGHTTMIVFAVLAGAAVALLARREAGRLAAWLMTQVVIAAGWAWWGAISLRQALAPHGTVNWIPRQSPLASLRIVEQVYLPDYLGQGGVAAAVLLTTLAAWLARFVWRDRRPAVVLLAALVVGAPILLIVASAFRPILLVRTLYWVSGPLVVLVALALADLEPRRFGVAAAAGLLTFEAALLVHWLPARQLESWPAALANIARVAPDAIVMVDGDAMALAAAHYLPRGSRLRLVALRRPVSGSNSWADGLFAGPHVDGPGAAALLRREHRIFTLTIGDQNPARALAAAGHGRLVMAASRGEQPLVWVWRD